MLRLVAQFSEPILEKLTTSVGNERHIVLGVSAHLIACCRQ